MIRIAATALATVAAVSAVSFAGASVANAAQAQQGWPTGNASQCQSLISQIDDLNTRAAHQRDNRDERRLERQAQDLSLHAQSLGCI
ncbi:hypothetical protein [Antrihabitans cavernicola]|uniref:Secreted protein n=1 Tax=Antrihabitans cavernicola TaxID=2495913 RepID=A0A5A7S6U3_9NOCA|nr:hypothetical protein [Spelaeibacter cavernicola]KAA0020083.1 hypothetical protein FOY51_22240 [Spelaeibacter cavernicola]